MEIQTLYKRGTGGHLTQLMLSDGSSFFISSRFVEELGIQEGDAVSDDLYQTLQYRAELEEACRKGMDLLSRAEQSEGMMRRKLLKRNFRPEVVAEAVVWLTEQRYLENRRYAEQWVTVRLRRNPEGRPALLAGLLRRGVDRRTAEDTVARLVTAETEAAALERAIAKLKRRHKDNREKIYSSLVRKGFSHSEISTQLERFSQK